MAFRNLLSPRKPKEEKAAAGDDEWEGEGSTRLRRAYGSMSVSRSGRFKSKSRQRKSLSNALDLDNNSESLHSPKTAASQNDVKMTTSSNAEMQTTDRGPAAVTSSINDSSQHAKVTSSPEVERNSVVPKMAKGTAFASKLTAPGYSTALWRNRRLQTVHSFNIWRSLILIIRTLISILFRVLSCGSIGYTWITFSNTKYIAWLQI